MVTNDPIVLRALLEERHKQENSNLSLDRYFERLVAEQLLKNADPSYDELEAGLVGGPGDGGIDGFFVLLDGKVIMEDADFSSERRNIDLAVRLCWRRP